MKCLRKCLIVGMKTNSSGKQWEWRLTFALCSINSVWNCKGSSFHCKKHLPSVYVRINVKHKKSRLLELVSVHTRESQRRTRKDEHTNLGPSPHGQHVYAAPSAYTCKLAQTPMQTRSIVNVPSIASYHVGLAILHANQRKKLIDNSQRNSYFLHLLL